MFKILHVTNSLGTGGAERLLVDLARFMDKDRFRLTVCCTRQDGLIRKELEKAGCGVIVLGKSRRSAALFPLFLADVLAMGAGILRVIRTTRPDLMHSHLEANYIAPYCAHIAGVKASVASFHSSVEIPEHGKWSVRGAARRAMLRRLAGVSDALVAGSEYAAAAAVEFCGEGYGKMHVIYNAVDTSYLGRVEPHEAIRGELGLSPGELLVATLGTVKEAKNHQLLVRAMKLVGKARPDVSAVAIGGGSQALIDALRRLVDSLDLDGKVHFLGYREDAYSILKACDVFVLPSLYEGLPLAAVEAMACELPVIISDIPPHRELVEHGVDGWLFRSGDEESLADMIILSLSDRERSLKLAQAGLRKVRDNYDSSQMARRYEELYESCLGST
jgi:glycosyltransferase involved in cell wall biosynthesis